MIRKALEKDIIKIGDLLSQVDLVHYNGRPDIFRIGRKYSDEELKELLKDEGRPILVSVDENDEVMGYGLLLLYLSATHKRFCIDRYKNIVH